MSQRPSSSTLHGDISAGVWARSRRHQFSARDHWLAYSEGKAGYKGLVIVVVSVRLGTGNYFCLAHTGLNSIYSNNPIESALYYSVFGKELNILKGSVSGVYTTLKT